MKSTTISLGRREFLHSAAVFGAGAGVVGACSDNGTEAGKFFRIDATNTKTGYTLSLDATSDLRAPTGTFTSDVKLCGSLVLPSGEIFPICVTVEKSHANALSLRQVSGDQYGLFLNGNPQPPEAPFVITLTERTIPKTEVTVITGHLFDPKHLERVTFTITQDPIAPAVPTAVKVATVTFMACQEVYVVTSRQNLDDAKRTCKHGIKSVSCEIMISVDTCSVKCSFECMSQGSGG